MPELPRQSYAVHVTGACPHRWPGTVHVERNGTLFKLASDFATCPECGANATTVLFWEEATEEGAVGLDG